MFRKLFQFFIWLNLVFIVSFETFSQGGPPATFANGIIPEITPPSPEASALGKYGDWPVSLYTGVPDISIPIYNISVGGYSLPIQLNYHAGGVKIDEVSSWVGSNWTLNAGGMISRTVVGLPDEKPGAGFLYRNQGNEFIKSSYDLANSDDYTFMRKVSDQLIDVEPDLFYFNFAGLSGKFFFDKTGQFRCIPANNLRLLKSPFLDTHNSTLDQHWEIADQSGNVYYFGSYQDGGNGFESSTIYTNSPSASQIKPTGWYLTKIVLANNADIIYLDYLDKSEHYEMARTNSFKILTNTLTQGYSPPSGSWDDALKLNTIVTGPSITTSSSGKCQLSKIRWKQGEVDFIANTDRVDLTGKLLDGIVVFDKNNNKIKDFQLNHSTYNQRHYLVSLLEKDRAGTVQLKHVFDYIQPANLPLLGFKGQDHWGFYNGANNNSLLPPDVSMNSPGNLNANREPNEELMQYGTLNRITYPTGGYTLFEYEAHRYDPASPVGGGSPASTISTNTLVVKAGDYQPPGTYPLSLNFTVSFEQNTPSINIQFSNYNKPASKELAWLPSIKIEKLVNGVFQQYYYWDAYDKFPIGNATVNSNGLVDFNISESLYFTPGDYRVVANQICGNGTCGNPAIKPSVAAQLNYFSYNGQLPVAGGLRVKQITNYNTGDIFISRKKYSYSPGKLLIYPKYIHQYGEDVFPLTSCYQNPQSCGAVCMTIFAKYKEVTSSSQSILGFTQGSPVGYGIVTEKEVDFSGTDNGYTETGFTFAPDILNSFSYSPYYWPGTDVLNSSVPLNNFDYKRGLVWYKNIYKRNSDGNYTKAFSQNNEYDFNITDASKRYYTFRGMRVNRLRSVNYPCGSLYNGYTIPSTGTDVLTPDFGYAFYDLTSIWVQRLSSTESSFDANGANPILSTTTYSYGNPIHMFAGSITSVDSKGNSLAKITKYPDDFSGLSAGDNLTQGVLLLQQRNIQDRIVESSNTLQKQTGPKLTTSSTLNIYSTIDPYLSKVMLIERSNPLSDFSSAYVLSGGIVSDVRYKDQVVFDNYDNFGNITQLHKANDGYNSVLWDYKNQYVTAEVKNGRQSDIAYTSFEADGKGNWSFIGTPVADAGAMTGRKVYDLGSGAITRMLVAGGNYVISYWSKSGGKSISGTTPTAGRSVNGWTYYENKVNIVANSTVSINGSGVIDELRLYPEGAKMTSYTYDPLIGQTSVADPNGEIVYYEYDNLNRLKNIKDYQGNIVKNFQYNYATSCGANCVVLTLQTFTGYNTPSYPVGVFNGNKQYIGIANTAADYVNLWNGNAVNQAVGVLTAGTDQFHFNLSLAANAAPPPVVFGLRFYQWVGFLQNTVNIGSDAFSFIDWGDGSQELLSDQRTPVSTTNYYNYIPNLRYESFCYGSSKSHTYSTSQPRTIRVFHNETTEWVSFGISGTEDFTQTPNITGYYPERVKSIAYNNITNSSDIGVSNFSSLADVVHLHYQFYTSATTRHNNWQSINNFHKLKWLKLAFQNGAEVGSNFRVNFPALRYFETQSFKPDITQIFSGNGFPDAWAIVMGVQPNTISSTEIDAIIMKQAADGTATNGFMGFLPTPQRSAASNTAYNTLISRGWNLAQITNP